MMNGLMAPSSAISLAELDVATGTVIAGVDLADDSGAAIAGAGDVNGDGFADVLIGAPGASRAYLLFGTADGLDPVAELDELDGTDGFVIVGGDPSERVGASVAGVGDVNGDGFADILVGVASGGGLGWESYLLFGREGGFAPVLDLEAVDGTNGVALLGTAVKTLKSATVAGGGDINGDGFADLVIGAPFANPSGLAFAGETYVVFGRDGGFEPTFVSSEIDGTNGFVLAGVGFGEQSGASVADAGDINGDGFADILIGTAGSNRSYVVYGKADGFAAALSLGSLDGSNGFVLEGEEFNDIGTSKVAGIGDVNGDGIDDIAIGEPGASTAELTGNGHVHVVFGSADEIPASLMLNSLDGTNGFALDGAAAFDEAGASVAGAGDVNADGIDDLLVGAPGANIEAGKSYVVFGREDAFAASFSLAEVDSGVGVVIEGASAGDNAGTAVAGLGDVNGDGVDDLAIGAPLTAPGGEGRVGQTYVLYGPVPPIDTGDVVLAINVGGPALTHDGISFAADEFFAAGSEIYTDNPGANGEQDVFAGTVYATERFGPTVDYALPVAPGSYTVELYFAEIWDDAIGDRVFDVVVEGMVVASDYDILEATDGDINQSTMITFENVRPDAGDSALLEIALASAIDNAKLSAIVVRSEADAVDESSVEGVDADFSMTDFDILL